MWKKGPLPPNTYGWGGVVPVDVDTGTGFFFADFQGDKVVASNGQTYRAHEVVWYDNSLELPPKE